MRSRFVEKISTDFSASFSQGSPRISAAAIMEAAVALVYVLVAFPYSGPARIGSLLSASFQQLLPELFEISASSPLAPLLNNSTNSALSPDVVSRIESGGPFRTAAP